MRLRPGLKLESFSVKLQLPYLGGIEGTWQPDAREREAAWELYVELVTRVAVVELRRDEGTIREALTSLYSLFETTRGVLRRYGPTVARPKGDGTLSLGRLAVAILNGALRPYLRVWHPRLRDYEDTRLPATPAVEHERAWSKGNEARAELELVRESLVGYANLLAAVAGVEPIHLERTTPTDSGASADQRPFGSRGTM